VCTITCHSSCLSCFNSSSAGCLSCRVIGAIINQNTCMCSSGYVPQSPALTDCVLCHGSCLTCINNLSTGCTFCRYQGTVLTVQSGGSCVCASNYVPSTSALANCVLCDSSCATCINQLASGCLTCSSPGLTPNPSIGGGLCQLVCYSGCLTCFDASSAGCLSCRYSGSVLSINTCICGTGYVPQSPALDNCVACHFSCLSCVNGLSSGCTVCRYLGSSPSPSIGGGTCCADQTTCLKV
jgi:hypothetical protein